MLRDSDLHLPAKGWGRIVLAAADEFAAADRPSPNRRPESCYLTSLPVF
jgi:hypothetical protein